MGLMDCLGSSINLKTGRRWSEGSQSEKFPGLECLALSRSIGRLFCIFYHAGGVHKLKKRMVNLNDEKFIGLISVPGSLPISSLKMNGNLHLRPTTCLQSLLLLATSPSQSSLYFPVYLGAGYFTKQQSQPWFQIDQQGWVVSGVLSLGTIDILG